MKPTKPISRMTAAEKAVERVAVAKDVVKQVRAGRLVARHNVYLQTDDVKNNRNAQLRDLLRGKECVVCAKGAVFVSMLDRFNAITLADIGCYVSSMLEDDPTGELRLDGYDIRRYVCALFSTAMIDMIEDYFEGSTASAGAYGFYEAYANAEDRLLAVMRNIIANGGNLKPEQLKGVKAALAESRSAT